MKVIAVLASLMMVVPAAYAQNQSDMNADMNAEIMDYEYGPMSQDAADALTPMMPMGRRNNNDDRGAEIIGGIIGIIGAIAADRIDRDHRPDRRPRQVTCYARDRRGKVYRAYGRNARLVQRRATNNCERFARYCRPAGCHAH